MTDAVSSKVLREAADWFDRQDDLSDVEFDEFLEWMEASPAHEMAFHKIQDDALDPALMDAALTFARADLVQPPTEKYGISWLNGFGRWSLASGLATAAILLVGLAFFRVPAGLAPASDAVFPYATIAGQTELVTLVDGSVVTLNAASAITSRYSDHARQIELSKGGAMFNVDRDPGRPFSVVAGSVTATALGTVYEVDLLLNAVEVRVYEGEVLVERGDLQRTQVSAGERIMVPENGPFVMGVLSDASGPAWLEGWMDADQTEVRHVIERLNRYRVQQISIGEVGLATERISGRFSLTDTDATLTMIASLKNAEIDETAHGVMLHRPE